MAKADYLKGRSDAQSKETPRPPLLRSVFSVSAASAERKMSDYFDGFRHGLEYDRDKK